MRAAEALTAAPITEGNHVELLINGDAIFPRYLETIAGRERSLNITTYAYWKGQIAIDVAEALIERANAGVEVNVLIDALGGAKMDRSLLGEMEDAGRDRAPLPPAQALRGAAAGEPHPPQAADRRRPGGHDRRRRASPRSGPATPRTPTTGATPTCASRGRWCAGSRARSPRTGSRPPGRVLAGEDYLPDIEPFEDGVPMQVTRSSAGVGDTNAEALTYLAIAAADRTLDLTSAYFVPRPAFLQALVDAAERGVRLRILVPGSHIDKGIVRTAGRSVYDQLLEVGAELYEYGPTMLHAKTLTVDGAWASVGSVNFDNRSFQLHDEAALSVRDEAFAAELTEQFERDIADSERIEPEAWAERGPRRRAAEAVSRLARREL